MTIGDPWGGLDDIAQNLDWEEYIFIGLVGACYFFFQHMVIHVLLKFFYPGYIKMNSHDLHEYRMTWNSLIHAITATFFALYCMYYTCPDNKTFFND